MSRSAKIGLCGLAATATIALVGANVTSAVGSPHPTAPAQPTPPTASGGSAYQDAADWWCRYQKGTPTPYTAYANSNSSNPLAMGDPQRMCVFQNADDHSTIAVPADTLAAGKPTLAALAYTHKPTAPPPNGGENPAAHYCAAIGGTDQFGPTTQSVGGWAPTGAQPRDFLSFCVFADRSAIDEWGLFYHTNDVIRGADLARKWRIAIPTPR